MELVRHCFERVKIQDVLEEDNSCPQIFLFWQNISVTPSMFSLSESCNGQQQLQVKYIKKTLSIYLSPMP
jgi:hypothetical protein